MVSFVFTDIEGSTRLFRRIGDRYPMVLERHHEILRAVWSAYGGAEVKTEGDAFFVAFADATDAIEGCAAAQRALHAERWPADAVIRVRMGIHTGLAHPRGDDYIAFAVHQAARVVSAGHGGQILVSADTAHRANDLAEAGLRSLGHFRVRDFDDPVELFQVAGDGLDEEFPPLRVLPADRHNLVTRVTSLLGRDDDLAELAERVEGARVVSVVGPGGLGKTRLVVEYGLAHAAEFEHGIWFAGLSAVTEPSAIPQVIADAVGTPVARDTDTWTAVLDHLRDRVTVVILDNCEHLVDEVARRVDQLVRACPQVRVVATSRQPLGLIGEHVWRPSTLDPAAAVALFHDRSGLPRGETGEAVQVLCERLDGLPLAIELAAARADVLTPAAILAGLDAARSPLTSRDPNLEPRQRSLEHLIEWSYSLLTDDEQTAFRRLGVFSAGFNLDAAGATVADDGLDAVQVPELVWSLAAKSLISPDLGAGTTGYRMLATIRSFARRLLDQLDDPGRVSTRLAHHYLTTLGPQIDKVDQALVSDRRRELDNLRGVLAALPLDQGEAAEFLAFTIVEALADTPREALMSGLAYLDQLPHIEGIALRAWVGGLAIDTGDVDLAERLLGQASAAARDVDVPGWLDGTIEQNLGWVHLLGGHPHDAIRIAQQGLGTVATPRGRSRMHNLAGNAYGEMGDDRSSLTSHKQALAAARELHNDINVAMSLANLAEASRGLGDTRSAAVFLAEALDLDEILGDLSLVAFAVVVSARLAASTGDWAAVTRLQWAAEQTMADVGVQAWGTSRAYNDELLEAAEHHLGTTAYGAERSAGVALPIDQAITECRRVLDTLINEADAGS
jgi:predicted ATPase/class 3 adenylate cyclase